VDQGFFDFPFGFKLGDNVVNFEMAGCVQACKDAPDDCCGNQSVYHFALLYFLMPYQTAPAVPRKRRPLIPMVLKMQKMMNKTAATMAMGLGSNVYSL
jgi:hypothetical protein